MKTASQILEEKGYDNFEIMDILQANDGGLDMVVREEYGLDGEPLHLLEGYYLGDANEDVVNKTAALFKFEDRAALFASMDRRLNELAEEYPAK